MQRDLTPEVELDGLLADWHCWCGKIGDVRHSNPMFRDTPSSRTFDSTSEIADDTLRGSTMRDIDFHVNQLVMLQRAAILAHARNCYTGKTVWSNPRLPQCPIERAEILKAAQGEMIRRLNGAGVMTAAVTK